MNDDLVLERRPTVRRLKAGAELLRGLVRPSAPASPAAVCAPVQAPARSWDLSRPCEGLGHMPALCVTSATGLLLLAVANSGCFGTTAWAPSLLWPGLLLVVVPIAARLMSLGASRQERIALVVLLGLALYFAKIMQSPFAFTYSDELLHSYNLEQILRTGALFSPNSILSITAYYPGLEIATSAVARVSGLDVFSAGLVVVGAARLVLMLSLFLFFESVSRSSRVAGIAAALYTANPNFVFWDAQFSYESLALPIALMVVFIVARRDRAQGAGERVGFALLAGLGIVAVSVTHHLSSYFLALLLMLWAFLARFGRPNLFARVEAVASQRIAGLRRWPWLLALLRLPARLVDVQAPGEAASDGAGHVWGRGPGWLALAALVVPLTWLLVVAGVTVDYLQPVFMHAVLSVIQMIEFGAGSRHLFVSATGVVAPLWQRLVAIGSVALSLLALPLGLALLWRRYRYAPLTLLLGVSAVGYFAMLGFRLTPGGWEVGNRASEFLFLGLSFVLAIVVAELWGLQDFAAGLGRRFLLLLAFLTLFLGGIVSGWSPQLYQAQPFLIDAGDTAIVPPGLAVAQWAGAVLGPDNRFAADDSNARFLLAYGYENAVTDDYADVRALMRTPDLGAGQITTLEQRRLQYVLMDRRTISWDNMLGYFANRTSGPHAAQLSLIPPDIYGKFDGALGASRILDAGTVKVYNVEALSHGMPAH